MRILETESGTTTSDQRFVWCGLAICEAIAQAHGGSIVMEVTEDAHTCFTLRLPLIPT